MNVNNVDRQEAQSALHAGDYLFWGDPDQAPDRREIARDEAGGAR